MKRGYPADNTKKIILETIKKLEKTPKGILPEPKDSTSNLDSILIFKTIYSNSFNKDVIKKHIKNNLTFTSPPEKNFNFKRSIICFKKDKTLLELLSPSKLQVPPHLLKEFN